MKHIEVTIRRVRAIEDNELPQYMTKDASGMDLCAAVDEPCVIQPGKRALIPTGIQVSIPAGYEAQIRPRSGLVLKFGVTVLNTPGTIDSDYRGEVGVIVANLGDEPFTVTRGMRIAQMIFTEVVRADFIESGTLDETVRNHGGFGHTGF
ncbi:MAG: dUTP diphosphatase [Candidatus Omnitrophica bacterium]|nr:dUTP diphosphatase [Candidatus Omnitrophota bacterium]